jgi:hypothetical protein
MTSFRYELPTKDREPDKLNIGLNYLTSEQPIWLAGPGCHRLRRAERGKKPIIDSVDRFVFLERCGKTLCVTGPVGSSDAKLRRAQALAISNGVGLEICRGLIDAKLQGQERVLREPLNCHPTADAIARFRSKLTSIEGSDAIRNLEANAAASYFREWRDLPVSWPKADLQQIPDHWRFVIV